MRRVLGALALLFLILVAPTASAHAVLERADPPVDGNVPTGIEVVQLVFTESVERQYTSADVFDMNGTNLRLGDILFEEGRNVIRVNVPPLEDGIYSVAWRALSTDTHTTRGTFLFSVGNANLSPSGSVVNIDQTSLQDRASLGEGITRAIFYAGLLLTAGWAAFILLVDTRPASPSLLRAATAQAAVGGAAGLFGIIYLIQRTGLDTAAILDTAPGRSIALRGGLLLLAGAIAFYAASRPEPTRRPAVITVILAASAAILATSLASHAAAGRTATGWAVATDVLHLVTAAIWVGGVVGFLVVGSAREPEELRRMILRFSPIAMGSVILLVITGTISAILHLDRIDQLWTDPYGRLVAFKSLLILPLVAIGAYNQTVLAPRMDATNTRRFHRAVLVEAITMALIIVAAGLLATSAPPEDADGNPTAPPRQFELTAITDTTHIVFHIDPAPQVGIQTITIELHPLTLGGIPNGTTVALKFAAPGEREPDLLVDPEPIEPGVWQLQGGHLTSPGIWKVYVLMQRPDEYAKLTFEVPVEPAGPTTQVTPQ